MHIKIFTGGCERIVNPTGWIGVLRPGMRSPDSLSIPLGTVIEMVYGKKNQLYHAMRRCRFSVRDIDIPLKSVPVLTMGSLRYEVSESSFFGEMPVHVVLHSVVQTYGLDFADVLTAFEIGHRFLHRFPFREYVTLFSLHDRGQLCELVMGDNEGGFSLAIHKVDIYTRVYDKDVRFLTVRRLAP
jgi:hypothetical protein